MAGNGGIVGSVGACTLGTAVGTAVGTVTGAGALLDGAGVDPDPALWLGWALALGTVDGVVAPGVAPPGAGAPPVLPGVVPVAV